MGETDLDGAVVIVAGGTGELGRRIAARLVNRGAAVTLAARDETELEKAASSIGAEWVRLDLRTPGDPERVVDEVRRRHGRLDGIVNAGGVVAFGRLETTGDEVIDELMSTNFLGPVRLIRAALPVMDPGFVVNISAVVAERPVASMVAYSASKAALTAAGRALTKELRRQGTRVLDVRPPHTETGLADRPIAGATPGLPKGLDPDAVADRIIEALVYGERELGAADFS